MSWTASRPIAQFGLVAGSSVAVGAELGRWDDTQKKYLSNLSKQTRQRTELSHRAALSVMCYWKNAGRIKLWTQRDGHSIGFWHGWNSVFENPPSFIGSNIATPFICENLWFLYIVILGISLPNTGVLPVFPSFFLTFRFSRCHREPGSLFLRVSAKMFIPLNSWLRMFCLLSPSLIQSVWRFQRPDSWKRKGLPRHWKRAVCSCPDQQNGWWVFSQVDFSPEPASVVGDMGTSARIGRHLIERGKT